MPLEIGEPLLELGLDRHDRALELLLGRDEVLGREDRQLALALEIFAGKQVDDVDRFDRVAEKVDAMDELFLDADELERIAAHAEGSAHQVEVVAPVLHVDQLAQENVAVDVLADPNACRHLHVIRRRAKTEDAGDRGDDQRVAARQQRLRRGMTQAFDFLVDRAVLLDISIGRRDVRLGLVVVEVRDEVLDRAFWEELPELGAELGGERLVVTEHQRRLLDQLDGARHRHRLAAPGHPEQRLGTVAA